MGQTTNRRRKFSLVILLIVCILLIALPTVKFIQCNGHTDTTETGKKTNDNTNVKMPDKLSYSIAKTYPHDTASFTEGLLIYKDGLYESTGEYGKSKLRKIDLATGKPIKEINIDARNFGEGIAILHDTIYQLTYKEHTVFVYDMNFKKIREEYFDMDTHQGWGMTTDGTHLIASDGSSTIYYFNPANFQLIKKITVTDASTPVPNVNELEWIDGYIYANQWQYPFIYKIDPATGNVVGKADFTDLISEIRSKVANGNEDLSFNGIAYDPTTKKIYVTGKNWPQLYEVKFE